MKFRVTSSATLLLCALWTGALAGAQALPSASSATPSPAADDTYQFQQGGRYRLTPTDVIDVTFPYVPEFNQTLTVQPDGYVMLRAVGELRVQGRTVPEARLLIGEAYQRILRDPVITIVLKEFERPYFIAAGEVNKPGKFELRGATTVTQAVAVAGGLTTSGKSSQVVLFRRYSHDMLEVKQIDVKKMLASRDLSEDPLLRAGDTLFVPKSALAQIGRFIAKPQLGLYLNPFAYW
jgi:polysaccharide export outer membrane protein